MIINRKKIQQHQPNYSTQKYQDSTFNSDNLSFNEIKKKNQLIKSYRKHFINGNKKHQEFSQTIQSQNKHQLSSFSSKDMQNTSEQDSLKQVKQKKSNIQQCDVSIENLPIGKSQSFQSKSSLQQQQNHENENKIQKNKKKFKLFCELKKRRNKKKKSQQNKLVSFQRQYQKFQQNRSGSSQLRTNFNDKQKITSVKNFLLTRVIKQKSKQKNSIAQQNSRTSNNIHLLSIKTKQIDQKLSENSSKRSKNSVERKQSTVKIKKSLIRQKFLTPKTSRFDDQSFNKSNQHISAASSSSDLPNFTINPSFLGQQQKKLSQIKQQRHQQTVLQAIKQLSIIDKSTHKNMLDQSSFQLLGINSICKISPRRKQSNNFLQTSSVLRQSALRRSIESSLSDIQKSRPKIKIQKYKQPLTIAEMGSNISELEQNMNTIQKIQLHIQIINSLSNFVCKSTQIDYLMEDWDELNFLIYKKFYIQRMKVLKILKKYPIKNPFNIKRANLQTKDIIKATKQNSFQIKRIRDLLEKQNQSIKKNLQIFYQHFNTSQHGEKINMFEYDNFSHFIYKQLWDEIQLFSYSRSHNKQELEDRICKSLQVGFLISELNGRYVAPFEDAEIASYHQKQREYIDDNMKIFQRYVLNKNR